MTFRIHAAIAALVFLAATGCVSDQPAVFEDSRLGAEAMQAFVGEYQVVSWPGEQKPTRVAVARRGDEFYFSYDVPGRTEAVFVLSKIPNSKSELLLLAVPGQKSTNQANLFFVCRADKERADLWLVFANSPVADGKLEFDQGKAKAEDVKRFLARHADALVEAVGPQVRLRRADG